MVLFSLASSELFFREIRRMVRNLKRKSIRKFKIHLFNLFREPQQFILLISKNKCQ